MFRFNVGYGKATTWTKNSPQFTFPIRFLYYPYRRKQSLTATPFPLCPFEIRPFRLLRPLSKIYWIRRCRFSPLITEEDEWRKVTPSKRGSTEKVGEKPIRIVFFIKGKVQMERENRRSVTQDFTRCVLTSLSWQALSCQAGPRKTGKATCLHKHAKRIGTPQKVSFIWRTVS